jgi:hypothetical protein
MQSKQVSNESHQYNATESRCEYLREAPRLTSRSRAFSADVSDNVASHPLTDGQATNRGEQLPATCDTGKLGLKRGEFRTRGRGLPRCPI